MRGKVLAGTLAAFLVAGCGSTKYVTQTQTATTTQTATQTQTQTTTVVKHTSAPVTDTVTVAHTVTAAASSSSGGYASTYPITFESSFDQSCTAVGSSFSACACILKQIEATVPYSAMAASAHAIFTGNPPSWFTDAQTACAGQ